MGARVGGGDRGKGPEGGGARVSGRGHSRRGQSWGGVRSEEHTSELQSRPHISYAVFCLKKKKHTPLHRPVLPC